MIEVQTLYDYAILAVAVTVWAMLMAHVYSKFKK